MNTSSFSVVGILEVHAWCTSEQTYKDMSHAGSQKTHWIFANFSVPQIE